MSVLMNLLSGDRWVATPKYLETMANVINREHDVTALATQIGKPLDKTRTAELFGDVAVVPVIGAIYRYANIFTEICGATSTEMLAKELRLVNENPKVKTIILNMDCPGGQAAGISELAQYIRNDIKKPIICYVDDLAASGGYWLASACDHIASSKTAVVGSIGAVYSFSVNKNDGVEKIEIVSSVSPKKRFDITTDEGKGQVQVWADRLGEIFVEDVAAFRGVTTKKVLEKFGQGDLLIGKDALKAGMVDEITTFESLLKKVKS